MVDRNGEPIEIPHSMVYAPTSSAMGMEKCLSTLIDGDAKLLPIKDEWQCDPLTWAARNSHLTPLQYLLGKEADVESKSYGGMRPLHHACHVYNEEVIAALIAKKADPNSKDDAGNTPFHFACRRCVRGARARPRRRLRASLAPAPDSLPPRPYPWSPQRRARPVRHPARGQGRRVGKKQRGHDAHARGCQQWAGVDRAVAAV